MNSHKPHLNFTLAPKAVPHDPLCGLRGDKASSNEYSYMELPQVEQMAAVIHQCECFSTWHHNYPKQYSLTYLPPTCLDQQLSWGVPLLPHVPVELPYPGECTDGSKITNTIQLKKWLISGQGGIQVILTRLRCTLTHSITTRHVRGYLWMRPRESFHGKKRIEQMFNVYAQLA